MSLECGIDGLNVSINTTRTIQMCENVKPKTPYNTVDKGRSPQICPAARAVIGRKILYPRTYHRWGGGRGARSRFEPPGRAPRAASSAASNAFKAALRGFGVSGRRCPRAGQTSSQEIPQNTDRLDRLGSLWLSFKETFTSRVPLPGVALYAHGAYGCCCSV